MPLVLRPIHPQDTLSWMRIRTLAYAGPTHAVIHTSPISDSSLHAIAQDRKRDLLKPHTWHFKIVDTDLPPGPEDPPDTGGRIITISVWSLHNVEDEGSHAGSVETNEKPDFVPPEIRLDALQSLLTPLRAAQKEIMGTQTPYLMLNSLATHPEHRGRGAAGMMLDWGLGEADGRGLEMYLDATGMARPIYERRGFAVVREVEWERGRWGGVGCDRHFCMVRGFVEEGGEGV